jgi:hypothetical protein
VNGSPYTLRPGIGPNAIAKRNDHSSGQAFHGKDLKISEILAHFSDKDVMDTSISLNGVHAAERSLEQTARKIATANIPSAESADTFELTDFAAELIALNQAKTAEKANLKVISMQTDLEREALNLFA